MKVLLLSPPPPGGGGLLEHQQSSSSSSSQVHYTLLVASVLLAFLLGAALSALLVSCYCGHQGAALGVGPEATLPRPLSLRSLARLNGLLLLDNSATHKVGRADKLSPDWLINVWIHYCCFFSSLLKSFYVNKKKKIYIYILKHEVRILCNVMQ